MTIEAMNEGPSRPGGGAGKTVFRSLVFWAGILQALIVAWQIFAVLNYDRYFAGHMPTMLDPDYCDFVTHLFWNGVIFGPFIAQFILAAILILKKPPGMNENLHGCIQLASIVLLALTLFCCLVAFLSYAGTYD